MKRFAQQLSQTASLPRSNQVRSCGFCILALLACLVLGGTAQAAIPQSERDVLIALYNSTNGDGWTDNSGWNGAPGTECSWNGVVCDGNETHVVQINLYQNNLAGSLPLIAGLTSLSNFDARFNQFTGSIPSFAGLTNLSGFRRRRQLVHRLDPVARRTDKSFRLQRRHQPVHRPDPIVRRADESAVLRRRQQPVHRPDPVVRRADKSDYSPSTSTSSPARSRRSPG